MERIITGSNDPRVNSLLAAIAKNELKNGQTGNIDAYISQLASAVNSGALQVKRKRYFFRKNISGITAGIRKFNVGDNPRTEGLTNLQNGKLPKGVHFLATDLLLGVAKSTSDFNTTTTLVNGQYSPCVFDVEALVADTTDLDSGATGSQVAGVPSQRIQDTLLNNEFGILLDNNEVINPIHGRQLFVYDSVVRGNMARTEGFEFEVPFYIKGDSAALEFQWVLAAGATTVVNYIANEVNLYGYELSGVPGYSQV